MPKYRYRQSPIRLAAVCLSLMLMACAGCSQQSPAQETGLDRILAAKAVKVCSTGDYRPFTFRDSEGNWSGLDIDMAGDLAHRLGVGLEMVPTTWKTLVADLDAKCDLAMGGITLTLDRAKVALFSTPYLRDGKAAIVRCADAAKFATLQDIDRPGVRVVTPPGGTNAEFNRSNLHHAQVIEFADNNRIFDQLVTGAADVMITDGSEIRWEIKQNPALCPVAVDHPFTFVQKAYLLPAGEFATQQWVNAWLGIVLQDGTYAALSSKYLG